MTLQVSQAHLLKRQPDTPLGRRDALHVCLCLDQGLRCGEVQPCARRASTWNLLIYIQSLEKPSQLQGCHHGKPDALGRNTIYLVRSFAVTIQVP